GRGAAGLDPGAGGVRRPARPGQAADPPFVVEARDPRALPGPHAERPPVGEAVEAERRLLQRAAASQREPAADGAVPDRPGDAAASEATVEDDPTRACPTQL